MDKERPIISSGTILETVSVADGLMFEHKRGGKVIGKRIISDKKEIDLLTKVVKIKEVK